MRSDCFRMFSKFSAPQLDGNLGIMGWFMKLTWKQWICQETKITIRVVSVSNSKSDYNNGNKTENYSLKAH
ncbi:hypothetical protein VNO77_41147 [Canavalia gladiata]|uniref:Uncharacterized protein n=1 Tax=Canavalia gladiata TaxID=3824 RepID=A0AAN9K0Q2_CANGL